MKRVVVTAVAAAVVATALAIGVWFAIAAAIGATIDTQAQAAQALLDADAPISEALVLTLRRPGIHVVALNADDATWIDAGSAGVHRGDGAGPEGPGPPPPLGPRRGPLDDGPRARLARAGPLGWLAARLVHHPPARVERGARTITIAPDAIEIANWLEVDALFLGIALVAIVAVAARRIAIDAHAQRRELERRAAERDEAARRYQRFLAETGHELRTPLTVMAGYVDILRSRATDEPLDARILEGMHAETARMRVLVEKMMTLARLDSAVSVPRLLDLGVAAREAAQTVQRRYPEREIHAETARSASVVIDADDYAAALINLLENAVKYAPASPVIVSTDIADGTAITQVVDRGPGISAAERSAIFEPFFRGGERTADGLGLGLAIVKRVADRWHGRVACESEAGRTTFTLAFPLADEERDVAAR